MSRRPSWNSDNTTINVPTAVIIRYKDIQLTKPDAKEFDVPADFKEYHDYLALTQAATMKMMKKGQWNLMAHGTSEAPRWRARTSYSMRAPPSIVTANRSPRDQAPAPGFATRNAGADVQHAVGDGAQ